MEQIGELQVGQDLKFEKRWWKIERTGWAVIGLLLLAALLGFLGPGPLTKKTAGTRGGPLWLEYHRFARYQAPVDWRIELGPQGTNKEIRLWVDRSYIEAVHMEDIQPQPESVDMAGARFVYTFKAADLSTNTKVLFHFKPNKFGKAPARLGLEGGPEIAFTHFFYP